MSNDIRIKKGLDIKLKGTAKKEVFDLPRTAIYGIKPTDFHGVTPKLTVKVGNKVQAGDILFYSKMNEKVKFASPVSGEILAITRGAKRKILDIQIKADPKDVYKDFEKKDPSDLNTADIKEFLSEAGCFPYFIQRPYDVIVNPDDSPKAIFISSFSTVPLAIDEVFAMQGMEEDFQIGIDAISKLTEGKVHLSVDGNKNSFFNNIKNVEIHKVFGKHPAGNVGVQINKIDPINQGEKIWTISPQDVAIIGRLFSTGHYNTTRIVAFAGSEVEEPRYIKTKQGVKIDHLYDKCITSAVHEMRIINGDVLSGKWVRKNNFLSFYNTLISVIPEGEHYTFFGWMPFTQNKLKSISRTFFSWLTPNKEYDLDTNINGEPRAMVMTDEMEKVFPMDIYPMQLLKATLISDIEKMEELGIYEVAPEDFALIDFVSSSKIEAQEIIREGLDLMIKEVG
ncbi:MAG TPA: Na(+)-translocating NADH-quinone reductase subunit A [Lutibacter sp.]|nr:Na(+)-translocating NADH-quinone reductase subunit A [Lutibacter sp.]